jgi:hypothetical protein
MGTIKAYRYEVLQAPEPGELGVKISLEPCGFDPQRYQVRESEVEVELLPDVDVAESGGRQLRIYRSHVPYGRTLEHALREGWCRILEPEGRNAG